VSEDNITGPLLVAMLAVHGEVRPFEKGARNDQGGYNYAPADAVIAASRKLLHKHGLGWMKTGQRMLPPSLASGDIGRRSYVGEAEISGFIYHAESGGIVNIVSQIPVVAMAATPHDKAAAASSTFGAGYMWLGILNADREGAHSQVNDREDHEEPMCVGKAAPIAAAIIERAERLAELDGASREAVYAWACSQCGVPEDETGHPGPKTLYVSEGTKVAALLKLTLEKRAPADPPGSP
jgi:hypothetical protein